MNVNFLLLIIFVPGVRNMIKEIAILLPLYITFFWSIVFIIQTGKKDKAKKHLGFFMIDAFLLYSCHAIFFNHLYYLYSIVEFIYVFTMLSVYPMYFLYLKIITSDKFEIKKHLVHFLPALIFGSIVGITTLMMSHDEKINYVKEVLVENNLKGLNLSTFNGVKGFIFLLSRGFFLLQLIYYVFKVIILAKQHNERIVNYYSNTEGKTLNWVRFISILIFIIAVSSIISVFLGRGFFTQHEASLIIPSAVFSTLLFIIGFKGNQQVRINSEFDDKLIISENGEMGNMLTNRLKSELLLLFSRKKIYVNPDLRITHISEQLKTNRTYISKMINEEFNMNFNEFVNQYRIEEAKKLLGNPQNKLSTMEQVAEHSGFGSVNSFSRIFKEITGRTPGKYRDLMIHNGD